jgi:hypothetical protein
MKKVKIFCIKKAPKQRRGVILRRKICEFVRERGSVNKDERNWHHPGCLQMAHKKKEKTDD